MNNAGILRDRMLASMTVHLKGTFCPTRHAAEHWRNRAKRGEASSGRAINTTSPSGLFGVSGRTNYVAAKAGIGRVGLADVLGLGSACAVQVLESHAA